MLREAARESADAFKPVARKLIVGETLETTGYNLTNAYANEAIKYTFKLKDAF